MPVLTAGDAMLLHVSNCTDAQLTALPTGGGRYPLPLPLLVQQAVSDRLTLAGQYMRLGDGMHLAGHFRGAISRHYYAMYHAARAITFAHHQGDNHQSHSVLPRNLPAHMPDVSRWEAELTSARLLRNQADYDPYPLQPLDWQFDSRSLASSAAAFVQAFEDFALSEGFV